MSPSATQIEYECELSNSKIFKFVGLKRKRKREREPEFFSFIRI
jgi:hypothetical protein